jgi:hypothetical protein
VAKSGEFCGYRCRLDSIRGKYFLFELDTFLIHTYFVGTFTIYIDLIESVVDINV